MTREIINEIGTQMAIKMAIINRATREGSYKDNFRKFPTYSEWRGMTQMLKIMGIDFEIHFDKEVEYMTGITIDGTRFDV